MLMSTWVICVRWRLPVFSTGNLVCTFRWSFLGRLSALCVLGSVSYIYYSHTRICKYVRNWLTYILGATTFHWPAPLATVVWERTVQTRSWTFPSCMVSPLPLTEAFCDSWHHHFVFFLSHTASGLSLTLQSALLLGSFLSSVTHMPV